MSILVIDPNIGSDFLIRKVFEEQGFSSVNIVKSAEQARSFLYDKQQAGDFDKVNLIVIDSELHSADAYDLCRELRKTEAGQYA